MAGAILYPKYPELVFGIAGPIGIDIDSITRILSDTLKSVAYRSVLIRITDEIKKLPSSQEKQKDGSYYETMRYKMSHASQLCRDRKDPSYLMKIAIQVISKKREEFLEHPNSLTTLDDDEVSVVSAVDDDKNISVYADGSAAERSAYIIRQIKRPEEVALLRSVYGKQFILLSAYGSEQDRIIILRDKIILDSNAPVKMSKKTQLASELIESDADESNDEFGQHTRDAFHLADMIIDGIDKDKMKVGIDRFINALFGANDIAPTKDEFGMSAASSVSLRSSDLSRQVGASIFADDGRVLAQGCNEVPKAFGGTYWDGELPDYRDIKIGRDSNDILKIDVLTDLVDRLTKTGILKDEVAKSGSSAQIVDVLIGRAKGFSKFGKAAGSLKNSKILDLTEYGRVVHAEMNAICDAARSGIALKNATLYTTTFPCHNCTKHILAAGISKVVYLEPYPKSKAKELHSNEISIEEEQFGKVNFVPFMGITPYLYRNIFSKSKRKKDGRAVQWQHGAPAPMINIASNEYISLENAVISFLSDQDVEMAVETDAATEVRSASIEDSTGPYDAESP